MPQPQYRPFSIAVVPNRGEVVVAPAGELDLTSADEVAEAVRDLRTRGFDEVVLDLRNVDFIDSTGLRMLLGLREASMRNGHSVALVPPAPAAARIFELTGTREFFEWRDDVPRVAT